MSDDDDSKTGGLVNSVGDVGTPWQQRAQRLFPKIKESVDELLRMGSKFTNPLQNFAVVSVVQDRDDPSVPVAELSSLCGMAILRAFNTEHEARKFRTDIANKGYKTPTYIIPMGRMGRFPPPANVPKEYHDPQMGRLMERFKHMANSATDHIQARITAMREKQEAEHAEAMKREEAYKKLLADQTDEKQADPVAAEEFRKAQEKSVERIKEFEYEATRLEKELEVQRDQEAKEAEASVVARTVRVVELVDDPALLKIRFAEEVKHQVSLADQAFKTRVAEAKKQNQTLTPSVEQAVTITTCAGTFRYIPTSDVVVDAALLATDAHLRKHGIIDSVFLKARLKHDIVTGFRSADDHFAQTTHGKRKPTDADAVEVTTVAGKIGYIPHHGPVLDDRLMATDKYLVEHGLPPLYGKEYTTSSKPPPAGSSVIDAKLSPPSV